MLYRQSNAPGRIVPSCRTAPSHALCVYLSSWWTGLAKGHVRPYSIVVFYEKKVDFKKKNRMPTSVSTTVVLRRPSKSLLRTKLSIPRISINACGKCGHRLSRGRGNNEAQKYHSRRPHSIHVDQDNYLHLQRINQVHGMIKTIPIAV